MSNGLQQSQFAIQEEQNKEDKNRLNQEKEDYQRLQSIFFKLELKNQQFNLIIEEFFQQVISDQTSPSIRLIQQARIELQDFDQLTQEIIQRLNAHIDGSISATTEEKALALTSLRPEVRRF